MIIDEILQNMRQHSMAEIRKRLDKLERCAAKATTAGIVARFELDGIRKLFRPAAKKAAKA